MTPEDIIVEYEALMAFAGETLKECRCGMHTHSKVCPQCEQRLSGDPTVDALRQQAESGEVDFSAFAKPEDFEPVRPGEKP